MSMVDKRPHARHRGTGEYYVENTSPLCRRCQKEISKMGFSNDPLLIDGAWAAEFNCFLHLRCYDKIIKHREEHRAQKTKLIKEEVERALAEKTALYQREYNRFDVTSHRQCTYCEGTLTNVKEGILYPREKGLEKELDDERDFYGRVAVHIECFNLICVQANSVQIEVEKDNNNNRRTLYYKEKKEKLEESERNEKLKRKAEDVEESRERMKKRIKRALADKREKEAAAEEEERRAFDLYESMSETDLDHLLDLLEEINDTDMSDSAYPEILQEILALNPDYKDPRTVT